jgi:hypothetical protein
MISEEDRSSVDILKVILFERYRGSHHSITSRSGITLELVPVAKVYVSFQNSWL